MNLPREKEVAEDGERGRGKRTAKRTEREKRVQEAREG
jgi:hypothetical protein